MQTNHSQIQMIQRKYFNIASLTKARGIVLLQNNTQLAPCIRRDNNSDSVSVNLWFFSRWLTLETNVVILQGYFDP